MAEGNDSLDQICVVALVAGETSGDLLGARLIRALQGAFPQTTFRFEGIGGPEMISAGMTSLFPLERLAVMGLIEPLGRLPELLGIRRSLVHRWKQHPPRMFIGIDAPDFNLGLARRLREVDLATAQLVSPTVWAWRPRRVHKVAAAVDDLLCLFPFEPAHYAETSLRCHFVGHPVTRTLESAPTKLDVRRQLEIDENDQVVALLPGSRSAEVAQLLAPMVAAGLLLKERSPRRVLLLPAANEERYQQCIDLLGVCDPTQQVRLLRGQSRDVMIAADVVLLASGTATLEAMMLQRPMAIVYRVAALSWSLMRKLVVTPFVGLPNVFANRAVVPELLQDEFTPAALALEAETLLREGADQLAQLAPHREALNIDFESAVANALAGPLRLTPSAAESG